MNTIEKNYSRTEQILKVMNVLAWIAFIGMCIEAGAILVSYGVSYINPAASKKLYKGLSLYPLRETDFVYYSISVFFLAALSILKAYILFLVIKALTKVNMTNPFSTAITRILENISYTLIVIWMFAIVNNMNNRIIWNKFSVLQPDWSAQEYIFIAGIVFIFSQVFKRGLEIQSEHELTV